MYKELREETIKLITTRNLTDSFLKELYPLVKDKVSLPIFKQFMPMFLQYNFDNVIQYLSTHLELTFLEQDGRILKVY